ncbi:hypothetical protein M2650_12770 [Luteimonas sp. SX5]|uniref:Uncharacterized protein n=1 Tax=Luteimonas galliterrae TaxID=2940486 RepID=A0ABT0MKV6_9GAMM|nr:hypothetical protein [Luteimonas galliterrae]MCL1635495.1 hypothetical protein [Luteimonas galliterrae]
MRIWALAALYCVASLVHFAHNAEYIAVYPNMPAWLTRENVYVAWLAVTGVGFIAAALSFAGWRTAAALCLVAYGGLGFGGLGHYALALCSEHTFAMNFTIWFEVVAGAILAVSAAWFIKPSRPFVA